MTTIAYKGWTIATDYYGFVATHDDKFDGESSEWQINAYTVEDVKAEIDEKEEE